MIHIVIPYAVAALLVGVGIAGIVVRRNAVLLLIGVELVLAGALVLFVTSGVSGGGRWSEASVLPLFVMTIAAAEVVVALAVILALFRARGTIDLDSRLPADSDSDADRDVDRDAVDREADQTPAGEREAAPDVREEGR